ncbi:TasA family protein [Carnobacterium inhibens]|uniref:Camelysin metallo-endopeptidase n=1 Tax=Carnobacterium inhibens subsp. gilichinskyi TaxID=1266845 RepID=U5SC62_9LACT|nr:TasA family protein [Carnobacterium inhibens]AGY82835.1 hypothetical protein Q783_07275 [Carnobacterium inhibens subsp. gilichinskyi]
MKKESASRRKKLPLLLGALLIISVAAYGTRAYFSDSAQMQGNIELELGDVKITSTADAWKPAPMDGSTNTDKEANVNLNSSVINDGKLTGIEYTNVRPGDSFTREYTITNNGSLDVNVNLNPSPDFTGSDVEVISENNVYRDGPFTFTIEGLDLKAPILFNKDNNSKKITVVITVDPETVGNEYNKKSISYQGYNEMAKKYLGNIVEVTAVQTNVKAGTVIAK